MAIYPSGVTPRNLVSALSIKAFFHSWTKHVLGSATFLRNVATVSRLVAVMRFTPSGDCTRMICGEKRTAPVSCGDTEPTTPAQFIPPHRLLTLLLVRAQPHRAVIPSCVALHAEGLITLLDEALREAGRENTTLRLLFVLSELCPRTRNQTFRTRVDQSCSRRDASSATTTGQTGADGLQPSLVVCKSHG